jgi:cellulose biosynthesis protein BcsQ
MEIIAFASGKGGTGKTLMVSCLGYALVKAGQRVLIIDGDPATDGISLFLLGKQGFRQVSSFEDVNTFSGCLHVFRKTGKIVCEPRRIHRSESHEVGGHGVSYDAVISRKGLYGDLSQVGDVASVVPDLDQDSFRAAIDELFRTLKESNRYDYVLVDTRGGFAFETTDVCALADSFIVITEPDYTSFYQDRNLVKRISSAAAAIATNTRPLLRAIIVNKATEGYQDSDTIDLNKLESSFRLELTKEFPLGFEHTYPVPADFEALKAYKTQRIPYLACPGSLFSFATLSAFGDILQIVTSKWTDQQVNDWNVLVDAVSKAIADRNARTSTERNEQAKKETEMKELRELVTAQRNQIDQFKHDKDEVERRYERELARSHTLLEVTTSRKDIQTKLQYKWWYLLGILALCVLLGVGGAMWIGGRPDSYKIYVIANPSADLDDLDRLLKQTALQQPFQQIGNVPVEVKSKVLSNDTTSTVQRTASELINMQDTLLVIGKLTSQPSESSLPIFFGARPQVPVIVTQATDDDLLVQCRATGNKCFEEGDPPLLQLSPTNTAQGKTSVLMAFQNRMHRFVIINDNNPANKSYVENVVDGYEEAIKSLSSQHVMQVGQYDVHSFNPNAKNMEPYDCLLYAGGLEGAITLLSKYQSHYPMIILSDSVLDGGIASLSRLPIDEGVPVYFISTIPAADYNARTNPYDRDALSIAAELIGDLNTRGNGGGVRRWLHLHGGTDARSQLVGVMRANVANRTSYDGASNQKYVFKGSFRQNGTYHVLQFRRRDSLSQGEMIEIEETPAALKTQPTSKSLPRILQPKVSK